MQAIELPAIARSDFLITEKAFEAGVYIHWPFCARKCPYCDFNSHVREKVDHAFWRAQLVREIEAFKSKWPNFTIRSIFFGGGTPSLMEVETCTAILNTLDQQFGISSDIEITLEANPSSVEADRFKGYRAAGVNRLSMGFQSLRDDSLKFLGRLHSASEAIDALKIARSVFDSVSFDLIYALPNQSLKAWRTELEEALSFGPDHLSLYQLTIEEGTAFWYQARRGDLVIPGEEEALILFNETDAITRAHGLPAYEISNHAKKDRESQHNLGYWQGHFYAGIGPGAHGRMPADDGLQKAIATAMIKRPEDWLKAVDVAGLGLSEWGSVDQLSRAREMLMMGLRLNVGISLDEIADKAGLLVSDFIDGDRVDVLVQQGFIQQTEERLITTNSGRPLLNHLLGEILL